MQIELNTLSKDELVKLKTDVEKALKTIDARRKAEAKKAADEAAKAFGFSLDELVSDSGKGTKGVPKYANPDDASQTWTGRGRKPNWVIAWTEAGKSLDDLAI
ncbi:H-NS histone family protein [Mesobacterium sp. TK19101]|uniref:H-NS histone family protein n=1 Tax=Mesobacterium hydrothermale TaxID=3111907 RepID=A0ABU6HI76_9RHOB|nr:H-NS histone family protein [Mesobacterium sp. TK19101]MEC3861535.1 H-NS histone family protein [Mesobacterium sp. TK19101]